MPRKDIGGVEEFPEGTGSRVEVSGIPLAVFNLEGELYAVHDNCRHKNLPLHPAGERGYRGDRLREDLPRPTKGGIDREKRSIRCPWHNLEWDLETGYNAVLDERIPVFPVEVEDRRVYVEI